MRITEFLASHIGKPCPYCGCSMDDIRHPTRDHVQPKAKGGADEPSNILIVCKPCNQDKADHTIGYFYGALIAAEDPRAEHLAALIDEAWGFDPKLGAMLCAEAGIGYAARKRAPKVVKVGTTAAAVCKKIARQQAAEAAARILGIDRTLWSLSEDAFHMSVLIGGRSERFGVVAVEELTDRIRMAQLRVERQRIDCRPVRYIPAVFNVGAEARAG